MKNNRDAEKILEAIKKRLPAKYRKNGLLILHQIINENKTIPEISKELKLPKNYIYDVLNVFENIGKQYFPADFLN